MGGGKGSTENLDALNAIATKSFDIGEPSMKAAMDVLYQALTTGGVEARQPVYAQAAEQTMQASSQAQRAMADDFSRTGIAGTPFAQQIMASMAQQAAQQAALVPTQMAEQDYWKILSLFFPGATQTMGMGVQGMGSAAGAEATNNAAMASLFGQLFSAPFSALSLNPWSAGSKAAGAGGTWV